MKKQDLIEMASNFVKSSEYNYIGNEIALSEAVVGMQVFETPIFAFGAADDQYFSLLKDEEVIGGHSLLPQDLIPKAKTVISFFLPFTEEIRSSNIRDSLWPSEEWLHGRIEGQAFLNKLCQYLKIELVNAGYNSIVPSLDERFKSQNGREVFTSNWSERHVAFICGLGTFGLSKGLITSKGMAGRFGSIVTELYLDPNKRKYKDIYEYCSMCGACENQCPANAISLNKGKNHQICSCFLSRTAEKYIPRYGCGKCQVGVPCEGGIPNSL